MVFFKNGLLAALTGLSIYSIRCNMEIRLGWLFSENNLSTIFIKEIILLVKMPVQWLYT